MNSPTMSDAGLVIQRLVDAIHAFEREKNGRMVAARDLEMQEVAGWARQFLEGTNEPLPDRKALLSAFSEVWFAALKYQGEDDEVEKACVHARKILCDAGDPFALDLTVELAIIDVEGQA